MLRHSICPWLIIYSTLITAQNILWSSPIANYAGDAVLDFHDGTRQVFSLASTGFPTSIYGYGASQFQASVFSNTDGAVSRSFSYPVFENETLLMTTVRGPLDRLWVTTRSSLMPNTIYLRNIVVSNATLMWSRILSAPSPNDIYEVNSLTLDRFSFFLGATVYREGDLSKSYVLVTRFNVGNGFSTYTHTVDLSKLDSNKMAI
jgi:hypothetical protein